MSTLKQVRYVMIHKQHYCKGRKIDHKGNPSNM